MHVDHNTRMVERDGARRKDDEMKNNHTSRIHIVYLPYGRLKTIFKLTIKFNSITLFERRRETAREGVAKERERENEIGKVMRTVWAAGKHTGHGRRDRETDVK